MQLKVIKRINKNTDLEITFDEERDLKEAVLKASPFLQMSGKCGLCDSENIYLQSRNTKDAEFVYMELRCRDCDAKQTFGEYKSPKGAYFLKKWDRYEKGAQANGE